MRPNYTTHSDSPFQTFIFLDLWKQHHPHLRKKPESTGRTNDTWQRWSSSNVVFNLQITWTLKHHFLHLMQMYDALRFWGFAYSRLLSIVSCLSWYLAILVPSRVNKYFFMVSSSKKPYWSVSYWSASWNPCPRCWYPICFGCWNPKIMMVKAAHKVIDCQCCL